VSKSDVIARIAPTARIGLALALIPLACLGGSGLGGFSALLKKELVRRPPDWPVYVEGDRDLEWRQVAEAIDAVRGQRAEVILLTGAARSQ
jgi:hypothetical protein